jgi:hypothetical protein
MQNDECIILANLSLSKEKIDGMKTDFLYTYSNTTKLRMGIENYLASKSVKEEERKKLFSACTPIKYYENH